MKTLHDLAADKLEHAGEGGREQLLRIPLQSIDRWMAIRRPKGLKNF
jgi:hypothetical protein